MNWPKIRSIFSVRLFAWTALILSILPIVFVDGQIIRNNSLISGNLGANFFLKLLLAVGSLAFFHFIADAWIKRTGQKYPVAQTFIMIFAIVVVVFFLYGRILNAQWWGLDDHEIMALLGTDGKMGIGELFTSLSHSEIIYFGDYPRFRPIYWLLRIIETILWGGQVQFWFAARLIFFMVFLFLCWKILNQFVDFWNAGLITLYIVINPFWTDIFTRLGPSEAYASIGLGLVFLGFFPIVSAFRQAKPSRLIDWLIFSSGLILSVGSKENMLFLIVFFLTIIVMAYKRKEKRRAILFGILNGVIILLVLIAVFLSANKSGADIHSVPTDPITRLKDLLQFLPGAIPVSILLSAGVCILYGQVLKRNHSLSIHHQVPSFTWYYFLLAGILWLVFSQKLFYPGDWPTVGRYAFPGLLFIPVLMAGNLRYFQNAAGHTKFSATVSRFSFSCILSAMILAHGFSLIRNSVQQQVDVTTQFTDHINRISTAAAENPGAEIVIASSNPLDYETIFSTIRFERAKGLLNRFFLYYVSSNSVDTRLKTLDDYLVDYSKHGSYKPVFVNDWEYWQGENPKRLIPLEQFDAKQPCLLINLSTEPKSFHQCVPVN